MTDNRIKKVRAEIERRVKFHAESSEPLASAYVSEDNAILSFIDSLQEEPVSKQNLSNVQRITKDLKESVSEDLGDYINELSKQFPEVSFAKLSRIAVRVAKWQKAKDQSTIELAEDHAYFAGKTKTIDEIKEALLSEVLPCFMHGGEADEVVAKLDEVLNQKK